MLNEHLDAASSRVANHLLDALFCAEHATIVDGCQHPMSAIRPFRFIPNKICQDTLATARELVVRFQVQRSMELPRLPVSGVNARSRLRKFLTLPRNLTSS
jgi:hypothetical protein